MNLHTNQYIKLLEHDNCHGNITKPWLILH